MKKKMLLKLEMKMMMNYLLLDVIKHYLLEMEIFISENLKGKKDVFVHKNHLIIREEKMY